ncbi:hypothetical protein LA428_00980 [Limosilactobacillus fermentum]|uniref:hypothetical protein n=1 Tax=Limosilactobacillus fermentum TaxID=1613 RepID=UPI001E36DA2E|nr:hypothetical protein [Limosilactobacillus fermentum]MCC6110239.1 hypothetical protein [Limosilactobacillus fermentum]
MGVKFVAAATGPAAREAGPKKGLLSMLVVTLTLAVLYVIFLVVIARRPAFYQRPRWFKVTLALLLLVAIIVRLYRYNSAMGIDYDEAMGGLNAWSLAKWGIDYFTLASHPIYLYAWGSGMNLLYPLLASPFVKFFGLSITVYRFPMVLLGVLSLLYLTSAMLKARWSNWRLVLVLAALALSPGMLNTSRWAVESNLFPALLTMVMATLLWWVTTKRARYFYLANLLLVLGAYTYANNWLFLATFILGFWLIAWRRHLIGVRQLGVGCLIDLALAWPLALFLWVNYVSHRQLHVLGLTITRLAASRGASQLVVGHGQGLGAVIKNLGQTVAVLFTGYDGYLKNGLPGFGILTPVMVVLAIVGALLVFKAKQRTDFDALMLMMLGANLPTVLLISPNNTHLNALTVPALYFAGMALAKLPRANWRVAGLVVIVVLFGTYAYTYLGPAHTALAAGQNETPLELQTMLTKADDNGAPIYLATNHQQAGGMYTVALFNHPVKPANFKQEAVKSGGGEFIHYYRYGRYHISAQLPKSLPTHAVLIVRRGASLQSAKQAGYHLVKAGCYYQYLER